MPDDAAAIEGPYRQLVTNPAVSISRTSGKARHQNTTLHWWLNKAVLFAVQHFSRFAKTSCLHSAFAVVENVVVNQSARSQGIGTALLREVEALSKQANCSKVMLLSSAQRIEAHKFFERQGFVGTAKLGFIKYRRSFA